MKSIRIQNLRSLADTGIIEIRPITILVGENSSGKSTFLRSFPLFRQSIEVSKTGPLLWFGKYVDFGSFEESLNAYSKNPNITIGFDFGKISGRHRFYPNYYHFTDELISLLLRVGIIGDSKTDSTIKWCEIVIEDNLIYLEFENRIVSKMVVNGNDYSYLAENFFTFSEKGILPLILTEDLQEKQKRNVRTYIRPKLSADVTSLIQEIAGFPISNEEAEDITRGFALGSSELMLEHIKTNPFIELKLWKKHVKNWKVTDNDFIKLRDFLLASSISNIVSVCNEEFTMFAENIRYIAPLRATAERYYRNQNLSVDEVDFQGQNLAMFIKNLSDTEKKQFSTWLENYFDFSPQTFASHGHVSIQVQQGENLKINLADMGFGFSQVLPILTQLWQLGQKNIYARSSSISKYPIFFTIEQPELHLHPRMQAKLAYAFTNIVKQAQSQENDIRLIIETHSDALVNTFGRLIAEHEFDPKDINIILFEKPNANEPTNVRKSTFSSDGMLRNWPIGFFEPD